MTTNLTPITPAEAFALARDALAAHEALIPTVAERVDPVIAETNTLIVALLRTQLTAAESLYAMTGETEAAFQAGYVTGTLTQLITTTTAGLARVVTR